MNSHDYLSILLTEGPPAARCELVRHLPSDDFGPRVLARLRDSDQPITVRGIAIADAAWTRASRRLQALAAVQSEHASELVAYGRHEGLAYFVHSQEGGPRLTTLLREHEGRLPLATVLPIFAQLLLAVGEAHLHGVVVGGVRPQDVRAISEGSGYRVQIRNLGMAAVLGVPAGRRGSTDHPSLYRAPEADVSQRSASDVFSLGVLFIRMLTGPLAVSSSDSERQTLLRTRLNEALLEEHSLTEGLHTLMLEVVDPDLETRPSDAMLLLEALLEVVPAAELRLPAGSTPRPRVVEDDAPQHWPARQWTVRNEWDRPREATPVRRVPSPSVTGSTSPAELADLCATPARGSTEVVQPVAPLRSRSTVRRFILGAGLSSMAAAIAITITIGQPGVTPASLPTASLATLATAEGEPVSPAPLEHATQSAVIIDANPPGVLTIDGRRIGPTSTRADIAPGRHVVRVEAEGHQTWRSRIEVAAGQEHRVAISLLPK